MGDHVEGDKVVEQPDTGGGQAATDNPGTTQEQAEQAGAGGPEQGGTTSAPLNGEGEPTEAELNDTAEDE